MILRRYGNALHSVEPNFDSKAMTEIGFRRDRASTITAEEFEAQYRPVDKHELNARAEGDVQDEVEKKLLNDLERQIEALRSRLDEDQVLVVESEQGVDYPKTRTDQKTVIVEGENRLYFHVQVSPPLRLGRYRKVD
jgi:hypothetical protein